MLRPPLLPTRARNGAGGIAGGPNGRSSHRPLKQIPTIDCVRHDKSLALTLHDATEAMRIGIALRTSLAERRVVEL